MKQKTTNKRWAAAGLVAGLMLGGGALANAATGNSSNQTPSPAVGIQVPAADPTPIAETPAPVDAAVNEVAAANEGPEVADANEGPEVAEANEGPEVAEANEGPESGPDCENGIVKGTTTECDGGPSANVDDGTEGPEAAEPTVSK